MTRASSGEGVDDLRADPGIPSSVDVAEVVLCRFSSWCAASQGLLTQWLDQGHFNVSQHGIGRAPACRNPEPASLSVTTAVMVTKSEIHTRMGTL